VIDSWETVGIRPLESYMYCIDLDKEISILSDHVTYAHERKHRLFYV
jgi:hypothetical protein